VLFAKRGVFGLLAGARGGAGHGHG